LITLAFTLVSAVASAAPNSLVCTYDTYSNETGNHKAEDGFILKFIVDTESGKAFMAGNQDIVEVSPVPGPEKSMNFIEITPGGNVMTTVVTSNGKSVHSRNTVLFGDLLPTQYYGHCE